MTLVNGVAEVRTSSDWLLQNEVSSPRDWNRRLAEETAKTLHQVSHEDLA